MKQAYSGHLEFRYLIIYLRGELPFELYPRPPVHFWDTRYRTNSMPTMRKY